jgi:choline dehydrogenase-like flavoprotein
MRHYVDLYLIRRTSTQGLDIHAKELAFSDLYLSRDGKLGSVQSFGALPSAAHLVESLGHDLHQGSIPFVGTFYKFFRPLLHRYLDRSLSGSLILASIVEDLPFIDNRVDVDRTTGRLCIHYHLYPQERRRIQRMRLEMRQLLKPYQPMVIRQAENNERLAHACGTCRFGLDPAASVLNRHSRAHDVENLYVADASIFPSSGGTNPSLTIAAIALRLADYLTARCAALR